MSAVYLAALAGNEQAQMIRGMNAQAAQQMLMIHHSTLGNGRPALARQIFAAELEDLGYPSDGIRNVAIANGSGRGQLEYRPLVEDEEGDPVRGPVVPCRVSGFNWRSPTQTIEKKFDLEVRLPATDTLLWSSTLRTRLNFHAEMRILPLTNGNGQDDSFGAFQYARVPETLDVIVIHQDGSLVTPDNPAMPGEAVTLFGTGIGQLSERPADGEAAAGEPLSECLTYPQALVTLKGGGELEAAVLFCGLTPGFAGLVQINLQLPDAPLGGPEPTLYLSFDGETLLSWPFAMD